MPRATVIEFHRTQKRLEGVPMKRLLFVFAEHPVLRPLDTRAAAQPAEEEKFSFYIRRIPSCAADTHIMVGAIQRHARLRAHARMPEVAEPNYAKICVIYSRDYTCIRAGGTRQGRQIPPGLLFFFTPKENERMTGLTPDGVSFQKKAASSRRLWRLV